MNSSSSSEMLADWKQRTTAYAEKPFWRRAEHATTSTLLSEIPLYSDKVNFYLKNLSKKRREEFLLKYRTLYLTECNRGEDTGTKTILHTKLALENPVTRQQKKTRNLNNAASYAFGGDCRFDVTLAKEINKLVGEDGGIFKDAGNYRTDDAWPAAIYDYQYTSPREIESSMIKLFDSLQQQKRSSKPFYAVASEFFVRFLEIHPFLNGNGRTARILLSCFLLQIFPVPIYIISPQFNEEEEEEAGNTIYVKCIRAAAHKEDPYLNDYRPIHALIIESCHQSLFECISIFESL